MGSPIHSSNLAAPVKVFLNELQPGSGQKIAGFVTHSAPAYPDQTLDDFAEPIAAACREKGIEYKGCFACQGALTQSLHEMVKKRRNFTDEEMDDFIKQMTGHPDEADMAKAKKFPGAVLS